MPHHLTTIVLSIGLSVVFSRPVAAEAPFAPAPTNQQQLDARVEQLQKQYAPYLRSLPKPLPPPKRTALPSEWKFTFEAKDSPKTEGLPPAPAWFGTDFDDSRWDKTTVPEWRYRMRQGDTAIDPKDVAVCATKGTSADTICWYRTTFRASAAEHGQRRWLCFDGVDWEAQVYLNGELLGSHRTYYEPFRFNVTDKLKPDNVLAVRVIAGRSYGEPISYWSLFPDIRAAEQRYVPDRAQSIRGNLPIGYHAGCGFGIHRAVYLEQSGPVAIREVFARNDLSDGKATVKIELDSAAACTGEINIEILPENFEGQSYGAVVHSGLPAGPSVQTATIPMSEAKVWSPQTPYLYRCRVTPKDGMAKDVLFGCRSFSIIHRGKPNQSSPSMPVYRFEPVKAKWLRILGRGSNASDWNSIWEIDCPAIVKDKNGVTASKVNKEYPPAHALDGNMKTRWALQGRGEWIQFALDDSVAFDRLAIGWFEAANRNWDFDLLVSRDGTNWTRLDYKPAETPGDDLSRLPNGMPLLNGKPLYLRGTNIQGLNAYWYWGQTDRLMHAILLLKAGHFNIVRCCQHVEFPEVRELMDRLGMLSEQDQGGGYRGSIDMGVRREPHIQTGTVLARTCYNNPGVVLLTFGNEHQFDTTPILQAAMAVDPQRVFKPISGRISHSHGAPLTLPDDIWPHVIDDSHPYSGWYGKLAPQTWSYLQIFPPGRMITLGEFGAEALDGYETMKKYPDAWKPPAADADTLWAASQVQKHDVRQIVGLGRDPKNLGEYIEASQNYQAALLADKVTGMRLSPRAIAGYFHFHFLDAVPVFWPKAVVSFDHKPKKAYYQLAQLNQPLVPLMRLSGVRPDAMTFWIANDLDSPFPQATLRWKLAPEGSDAAVVSGQQKLDVPALGTVKGETVDLSGLVEKYPALDVTLTVTDGAGQELSRYNRIVRAVPKSALSRSGQGDFQPAKDPFNDKKKK